jgi:hypothetical protein
MTSLSSQWMLRLGLKEEPPDPRVPVQLSGKKQITVRRKHVTIQVMGFPDRQVIPIQYSPEFRDDLIVISLAALSPYFSILLTEENTILFPN